MKVKRIASAFIVLFIATLMLFCGLMMSFSWAKYVREVGVDVEKGVGDEWVDIPYEVVNPVVVYSQMDLFNALKNGYSLVQIGDGLTSPIMMTGNSLDLVRDLILDLNGNEIECNNTESLLNIPEGKVLTIIDSKGGGGLYNPIGSVLKINGGKLQVYGGMFESGPRNTEYFYYAQDNGTVLSPSTVTPVKGFAAGADVKMPIIVPRNINGRFNGNVYFDTSYDNNSTHVIPSDTYCYMYMENSSNDDVSVLDTATADFAYSYTLYADAQGTFSTENGEGKDPIDVTIFGYENTIAKAGESENSRYAAVEMSSGRLQVNVNASSSTGTVTSAGSFYSYFGKENTACVYFTGGTMDVETTGRFATINPELLPDHSLAKGSEGSCVICDDDGNADTEGVLTISKAAGTTYNGSIIAMRGGTLNIDNATFDKHPSMIHTTEAGAEGARFDSAIFIEDGEMTLSNAEIDIDGSQYTYGILAKGSTDSSNAKLDCNNVKYTLSGSNSYGIYATHGSISVANGSFNLTNNKSCYGVYAVTRSVTMPVEVSLKSTEILIGGEAMYGASYETINGVSRIVPASVGVYLNSSENAGGRVNLDNVNIQSTEVGVAVNSGTLTFLNSGNVKTYNASAIVLRNGNVKFENNATTAPTEYTINSTINRLAEETTGLVSDATLAVNAGLHLYERGLPWLGTSEAYVNTDAIYVNGGNLTSDGKLNITHRGLFNNYSGVYASGTSGDNYNRLIIKSFGVMVNAGDVNIKYASIVNSVGGGVKVAGGTATLGFAGSKKEDISIYTSGTAHFNTLYNAAAIETANSWKFYPNLGGGYAITARAGSLDVYNGTYTADYGSAVLATENGSITIHDGEFKGKMKGVTTYATGGPSSHYGIKVTGAATIKIYGGSFDGKNGGALVAGTSAASAIVYIYKGQFSANASKDTDLSSQDGINIFDNSTVYLGAYTKQELIDNKLITVDASGNVTNADGAKNAITVTANLFPIAVNPLKAAATSYNNNVRVHVYYGTYVPTDTRGNYGTANLDTRVYAHFYFYGLGKSTNGRYIGQLNAASGSTLTYHPTGTTHYVRFNADKTVLGVPTRYYSNDYVFFAG